MAGAVLAAAVELELPPPQAVSVEHTSTTASARAGVRFKADSFYW
jgi:hypothetical protein